MPKSKAYDRIFSELFSTPWLITEEWMNTIIEIARRQGDIETALSNRDVKEEAVTARGGALLEKSHRTTVYGDTAVIPISGPIFPKSNLMTAFSGATSVSMLATDLDLALGNRDIEKIIFDVDSPGGHVTGIHEMANIIYNSRGIKPITAFVASVS